jgi:hypothetical protein
MKKPMPINGMSGFIANLIPEVAAVSKQIVL